MSDRKIEVESGKDDSNNEVAILLRKWEEDNVIEVLIRERQSVEHFTIRAPICPNCKSKPQLLVVVGKYYCFNCKKYVE